MHITRPGSSATNTSGGTRVLDEFRDSLGIVADDAFVVSMAIVALVVMGPSTGPE